MDLSAIKQKLQAQQSNGREREKIDYEATFWKPTVGKHQIRIVPSMFNPEMPFNGWQKNISIEWHFID